MEQQRKAPSEVSLSSVQRVAQVMQRLKEQDDRSLAAEGLRPNADPQSVAVAAMVFRRNPKLLQEFREQYAVQEQEKEFRSIESGAKAYGYLNDKMAHALSFGKNSGVEFDRVFDSKAAPPAPVETKKSDRARELPAEWLQQSSGAPVRQTKPSQLAPKPKQSNPFAKGADNVSEGKREQAESAPAQHDQIKNSPPPKQQRPNVPAKPQFQGPAPASLDRKQELLEGASAPVKTPASGNKIEQLKKQLQLDSKLQHAPATANGFGKGK